MFDRFNFVKRSLLFLCIGFLQNVSFIEEIGELSTEENPDTIRERPLMTSDFRVGRESKRTPKLGRYRVKIFRHSR